MSIYNGFASPDTPTREKFCGQMHLYDHGQRNDKTKIQIIQNGNQVSKFDLFIGNIYLTLSARGPSLYVRI